MIFGKEYMTQAKLIGWLIAGFVGIIMILALNPLVIIGAGERGVVFNNTTGIEDQIMGEGLHFRMPFVQSVRTVSVRVQTANATATAGTNDLQTATIQTVVNWRLNPERVNVIYQEIGDEEQVVASIITPRVDEVVKAISAQYSAEELLTKRGEVKVAIDARLREDLAKYNVILSDVSLADIDFSADFNAAIERKATAEQNALASKNQLEQTKYEAEGRVVQAKGEAEALRIQNEALANNTGLIELTKAEALKISAEKGQKIVPDTVLGSDGSYLYNLK